MSATMTNKATVRGASPSSPPRQIDIDPKSARTVVHEVYARRRVPSDESKGAMIPDLRVSPFEDKSSPRKAGVLPDQGIVARRRRSAVEGGSGRQGHRYHDSDSDSSTDSEPEYVRPRHRKSHHRHHHSYHRDRDFQRSSPRYLPPPPPAPESHSPRSHSSTTSSSRSHHHHHHKESKALVNYDPGLDEKIDVPQPHGSRSRSHHTSSSDSEGESDFDPAEERKAHNHALLYTGLAALTTAACANGIYQHTKGFHARHQAHKEANIAHPGATPEEEAERRKARNKRLAMDAFAAGVLAIGLNNVRIGWGRREEMIKAHREAEKKAWERNVRKMKEREGLKGRERELKREARRREKERAGDRYSVEEA